MASFSLSDLEFLLDQIRIAEAHASGQNLVDLIPNTELAYGLRIAEVRFRHPREGVIGRAEFRLARGEVVERSVHRAKTEG